MQVNRSASTSRRRRTRASLIVLAAVTGLGVVAAGPAGARPIDRAAGASKTSSSVTMVPVNASDPVVNFNDEVTFQVSQSVTDRPMVKLECSQNGVAVYWDSAGFYPDYPWPWGRDFLLRSDYWTGGAADCVGTLYYSAGHNKFPVLATTTFHVEA